MENIRRWQRTSNLFFDFDACFASVQHHYIQTDWKVNKLLVNGNKKNYFFIHSFINAFKFRFHLLSFIDFNKGSKNEKECKKKLNFRSFLYNIMKKAMMMRAKTIRTSLKNTKLFRFTWHMFKKKNIAVIEEPTKIARKNVQNFTTN